VGAEDASAYRRNVTAFRASAPLKKRASELLKKEDRAFWEENIHERTPALVSFANATRTYRQETLSVSAYLEELEKHRSLSPGLTAYRAALRMERTLNLAQVQAERRAYIEKLVPRMGSRPLAQLTSLAEAYRKGTVRPRVFCDLLIRMGDDHQVATSPYVAWLSYVEYVRTADRLDASAILAELTAQQEKVAQALSKSEDDRRWWREHERLSLTRQLLGCLSHRRTGDATRKCEEATSGGKLLSRFTRRRRRGTES
jgi:hypothetical protein